MPDFVVEIGEKLHIANKRTFNGAARRSFIGEVVAVHAAVVRIKGYLFVFNPNTNHYERKSGMQTRIIDLANGTNHVSVLPPEIRLEKLAYAILDGQLIITDGLRLRIEATEAGPIW